MGYQGCTCRLQHLRCCCAGRELPKQRNYCNSKAARIQAWAQLGQLYQAHLRHAYGAIPEVKYGSFLSVQISQQAWTALCFSQAYGVHMWVGQGHRACSALHLISVIRMQP